MRQCDDRERNAIRSRPLPGIGVAIVTYNASDVILDCLETLLAAPYPDLRVVVVDNASTDGTVALLRDWAEGCLPWSPAAPFPFEPPIPQPKPLDLLEHETGEQVQAGAVTLVRSEVNTGFAGGVNIALAVLRAIPELDLFWILNPDTIVPTGAPRSFGETASAMPDAALIGGRILYATDAQTIQYDGGGRQNIWTGISRGCNRGRIHARTPPPDPARFDFISGANMMATRRFLDRAGPLREDYFLYYEEVDWAFHRGELRLAYAPGGTVYHHAGSAIGSGNLGRRATSFSNYFMYRNRMRLIARFNPVALPVTYAYSLAKIGQLLLWGGAWEEAAAAFRGMHGMGPPTSVRERIAPVDRIRAFGRPDRQHREAD